MNDKAQAVADVAEVRMTCATAGDLGWLLRDVPKDTSLSFSGSMNSPLFRLLYDADNKCYCIDIEAGSERT